MVLLQAAEAEVASLNLMDMAMKGGWIMIPLLLLCIMAIYIFIERLIVIRKASYKDPSFMNKIKDYINEGKIDAALTLCKNTDTPYSRMVEKGIERLGRPMNDVLVAVENVGNIEVGKLERGLSLLATTAGGGPMIGFLGTVIGMIQAFFNMANAGNNVDVTSLADGIYTAMVTTVAGLIVGIIAFFAYNYLTSKVDTVVNNMEARTLEFMDILNEPAN
ncbi:MAG: MotA/TolQ/ExbB proton channel family protein [Paludibacteraceae bacterium]|jgi:biopolymer transport protein ExbB|nr:MotA/TolQ/ExbB proton channel family protein [Paludibacteraceae bacterium]MEE3482809.1 MotA/TolQ/ExbB proton channel family protein [Bacteroidales bacterium]